MASESKTSPRASRVRMRRFVRWAAVLLVLASTGVSARPGDERMEGQTRPLASSGLPPSPEVVKARWQFILDRVLPLATARISAEGSFYPFAALLDAEGDMTILAIDNPAVELPSPREALRSLVNKARDAGRDGRVVASVYFADALVDRRDTGVKQAGVRIKLDDYWGESMEAFVPYVRDPHGKLSLLTPEYRPSRNATYR